MPTLTYRCANQKCQQAFTTSASKVKCPHCKGTRASWIPQPFGIAKAAPGIDRELRTIADGAGLTDLRSARYGEPARPRAPAHVGPTMDWASPTLGHKPIKVNLDRDTGRPMATAAWSGDTMPFVAHEKMTYGSSLPGLSAVTEIIRSPDANPKARS